MFLFLGFLWIAAPLIAAENLLIVDVYVRILPEDQIEPIPKAIARQRSASAGKSIPDSIRFT
jgi:hypothetical protein